MITLIHAVPVFFYIILVSVYLFVSVFFSFFVRSGFHMKAYCRKETNEKIIALTFDDGPDPGITPVILDILKDKAKATFFCISRKIEGNEQILKRMDSEGHLIGSHSYSHSDWFDFFSSTRMKNEFILTDQKILEATGKKPLLFRPPYGVINPLVKKALQMFNYHVIGFSNRSWDTITKNEKKILERLTRKLKPGDVVLLHDSVPQCIPVLKGFMKYIEENGFTIVSIADLFEIQPYA
jgi:peptidoglycan/xylan/chitin deacetylase (PgdA/CDA1 family)